MQISIRFTMAIHIFSCIDTFEKDYKIKMCIRDRYNTEKAITAIISTAHTANNAILFGDDNMDFILFIFIPTMDFLYLM